MIDLDALEVLLAKMVPAPWHIDDDGSAGLWGRSGSMVVTSWTESEDTAAGIVALVNAAPALLAEIRELRADRDEWKRAAESQNRQWSAKCTELTEERAKSETLEASIKEYRMAFALLESGIGRIEPQTPGNTARDVIELAREVRILRSKVEDLERDAGLACENPVDGCDCPGCSTVREIARRPGASKARKGGGR